MEQKRSSHLLYVDNATAQYNPCGLSDYSISSFPNTSDLDNEHIRSYGALVSIPLDPFLVPAILYGELFLLEFQEALF